MPDYFNVLDQRSGLPTQIALDRDLKAWSFSSMLTAGTTALTTAGTLYLVRVRRVPAGTVTNIIVAVGTAGSSLTAGQCFAGLFNASGTLLSATADQAAAWGTTGTKTMALTTPQAITSGDYYVGFFFNGTTGPAFTRSANTTASATNVGLSAPNLESCSADTGLTTAMPATFGAQTSDSRGWWVALS